MTGSPDGADRWIDRFQKATESLRDNPVLFPLAPGPMMLILRDDLVLEVFDTSDNPPNWIEPEPPSSIRSSRQQIKV